MVFADLKLAHILDGLDHRLTHGGILGLDLLLSCDHSLLEHIVSERRFHWTVFVVVWAHFRFLWGALFDPNFTNILLSIGLLIGVILNHFPDLVDLINVDLSRVAP